MLQVLVALWLIAAYWTGQAVTPSGSPPVNTVAPTISPTTVSVGTVVNVTSTGTWTGSPTFTCQWEWFDTLTPIGGATSCSSYTAVSGDVGHTLADVVTGTNGFGSAAATSNATSAVTSGGFSPTWQDAKLGAGGLVSGIAEYPDGFQISVNDTYSAYGWNGSAWFPLFTSASLPSVSLNWLETSDGAYDVRACAYDNNSATTVVGSTSILYGVWRGEVYKSTNQGAAWTDTGEAISTASGNNTTQKLQKPYIWCDPASNGQIVYISTPSAATIFSINGGATWNSVPTGIGGVPAPTSNFGTLIVSDPGSAVVSGATQHFWISSYGHGIYETTNGGTSFSLISGSSTTVTNLIVDKYGTLWGVTAAPSIIKYASSTYSTSLSASRSILGIAADPSSASQGANKLAFVYDFGGTGLTTNNGGAWSSTTQFQTYPHAGTITSTDIPWLASANYNGAGAYNINALKMSFNQSGLASITNGVAVFTTTPTNASYPSFTDRSSGIEQLVVQTVLAPPSGCNVSAVWDRGVFPQCNLDVFPSSQYTTAGLIVAGWDVDYASQTPSFLTAFVTSNIGQGNLPATSSDGGHTWTAWTANPASIGYSGMIAADTTTDWIAIAATGQTPTCTTNGATSWATITFPGSPTNNWMQSAFLNRHILAADRVTSGVLYAYDAGQGLFSSSGGCAGTWTKVLTGYIESSNTSFENFNSRLKAVPWYPGHLFFTNGPQGGTQPTANQLFRSTNGGGSFSAVANVKEPIVIGFGAPKPGGGGYDAIFMYGFVSSVLGLWESDDNATTWMNLGAYPQNNTDYITDVTGDPTVYGRVVLGHRGSGDSYYDNANACPAVKFSNTNPTASLTGTVSLQAAQDGLTPVSGVKFLVDGSLIGSQTTPSGTPPTYTQSWVTGGVANGAHMLSVVANGNGCSDSTFNGSISGATLTVNSGSAPVVGEILAYAGMPANAPIVISGSGTTFTLNTSPGNVSAVAFEAASALQSIPITTH